MYISVCICIYMYMYIYTYCWPAACLHRYFCIASVCVVRVCINVSFCLPPLSSSGLLAWQKLAYWYKSTYFTGTKVQILTQKALFSMSPLSLTQYTIKFNQ